MSHFDYMCKKCGALCRFGVEHECEPMYIPVSEVMDTKEIERLKAENERLRELCGKAAVKLAVIAMKPALVTINSAFLKELYSVISPSYQSAIDSLSEAKPK